MVCSLVVEGFPFGFPSTHLAIPRGEETSLPMFTLAETIVPAKSHLTSIGIADDTLTATLVHATRKGTATIAYAIPLDEKRTPRTAVGTREAAILFAALEDTAAAIKAVDPVRASFRDAVEVARDAMTDCECFETFRQLESDLAELLRERKDHTDSDHDEAVDESLSALATLREAWQIAKRHTISFGAGKYTLSGIVTKRPSLSAMLK